MNPLTIIDDIIRRFRGLARITIVPEQEDPIKWFSRYRQKRLWQRRDWQKGLYAGVAVVVVIATVLKIAGVI